MAIASCDWEEFEAYTFLLLRLLSGYIKINEELSYAIKD